MLDPSLDILVISDLHYIHQADHVCPLEERRCSLGPLLLRKALQRLRYQGVEVGLIVVLGDVVDNGSAPGAERDLAAVAKTLAEEARKLEVPFLAVPGNHDGDFGRFVEIFGCGPGLHRIGGYGFLLFHDRVRVGTSEVTIRSLEMQLLPGQVAATEPDLGLVALQHNPLHPHVESDYPYMLANAQAVMDGYREAGVILSLSGHYHAGQPAHRVGGVVYYTVPAACERPFRFAHVRLRGREVEVREHALLFIIDKGGFRCHTE